jgi:hypothetical protein
VGKSGLKESKKKKNLIYSIITLNDDSFDFELLTFNICMYVSHEI